MTGQPPGQVRTEADALVAALASPRWRLRCAVEDLSLEIKAWSSDANDAAPVYDVVGFCGADTFRLAVPVTLLDAILARAPDSVTVGELSSHDCAILLEHLLRGPIGRLEERLGLPLALCFAQLRDAPVRAGEVPLTIEAEGRAFPASLTLSSDDQQARLAREIESFAKTGPDVVAGMPVVLGPIRLRREEIRALGAGDQFLLDGARIERLEGGLFLDSDLYWRIQIVDGAIQVVGPLEPAPPANDDGPGGQPLFFQIGVTAEASPLRAGQPIALQRLEEGQIWLRPGKAALGRGVLVKLPEGLAIRLLEMRPAA